MSTLYPLLPPASRDVREAGVDRVLSFSHPLRYVYLALLTSERAWAHAQSIKSAHVAKRNGIAGRTRSHVVSRLVKAARNADVLVEALAQSEAAGASSTDLLEAKAYAAMVHASAYFEKQTWQLCLQSYSVARVIYNALATAIKGDIFKDLLAETIDPSIRFAAYQLKTPRTIPIPVIARKAFPENDEALVQEINKIDPKAFTGSDGDSVAAAEENAPQTLTWRSREVKIEDAQIAATWGAVHGARDRLAEKFTNTPGMSPNEAAGAYDEILTATQEAVDATKQTIDELRAERVPQGDSRMQSLQITRTAVNYEMVSWRIGRNRVLTGVNDGASESYNTSRKPRKAKGDKAEEEAAPAEHSKELPRGKRLAKLKEKAALYDGTLQNLDTIKELPGVAADEELASKLEAFTKYFQALMALAIARSHAIIGNVANALALIDHAFKLSQSSASELPKTSDPVSGPLNVDVSAEAIEFLTNLLNGELQRHRAIVHIDQLRKANEKSDLPSSSKTPLIERLHEHPRDGVDLANIVEFPPKMALIPVKPNFLDVAWNYIVYPGKEPHAPAAQPAAAAAGDAAQSAAAGEAEKPQQKRGWFGFGR